MTRQAGRITALHGAGREVDVHGPAIAAIGRITAACFKNIAKVEIIGDETPATCVVGHKPAT